MEKKENILFYCLHSVVEMEKKKEKRKKRMSENIEGKMLFKSHSGMMVNVKAFRQKQKKEKKGSVR